jgi:hypothetical protein
MAVDAYDPGAALVPRGLLRFAPHNLGLEYHWRGPELLLGNYYAPDRYRLCRRDRSYLASTRNQAAVDHRVATEPRLSTVERSPVRDEGVGFGTGAPDTV